MRLISMDLKNFYEKMNSQYQTVLERFCNNETMLRRFVASFPNDTTFQKLTAAMADLDYTEIENQAHTLKGLSGNLGFEKLQSACSDVVLCIRQKKLENLQEDFQNIVREYETLLKEIQMLI